MKRSLPLPRDKDQVVAVRVFASRSHLSGVLVGGFAHPTPLSGIMSEIGNMFSYDKAPEDSVAS
jgi:hypothetical protein